MKSMTLFTQTSITPDVWDCRFAACGIFEHFSGFEFFLLSNIIHARPHATNANR
jgi:hypothetical protein